MSAVERLGRGTRSAYSRGMTLLEVMVALVILSLVAALIHGVIDSLSRGRKAEGLRADRAHSGREAMGRILRDLSSAYLSQHVPVIPALMTGRTAFVGRSSTVFDRIDFTAFAHFRTERDAHESDQAEVGYFVVKDPEVPEKMDLVRREQTPIDYEPLKGGIVNVVAEDVEKFDVRFLDPQTSQWIETWDSMQVTGQPNRLPFEVDITLVLKGVSGGAPYSYTTKMFIPIQSPLTFGIPSQ
jgi:general secretion pathway protein J